MRRALLVALAACSPAPTVLELPADDHARSRIIIAQRGANVVATVVLDALDRSATGPEALKELEASERVTFTVVGFEEPLDPLGLIPGAVAPGAGGPTRTLASVRSRSLVLRATVEGEAVEPFEELMELPPEIGAIALPSKRGCRVFRAEPLPSLEEAATFIIKIGDRHIVGTEQNRLFPIPPIGTSTDVTPRDPAMLAGAPYFPTWGALPVRDQPDQFWLSGRHGELWRVRFDREGRPSDVLERHNTGLVDGIRWFAGEASSVRTDLFFVALEGTVGRFDGREVTSLHRFGGPEGRYYIGGAGRDADGTFVGGFNLSDELAILRPSGAFSLKRVDSGGSGIASIQYVPNVGLLISDVQGTLYLRGEAGELERFAEAEIANGAEAIVPLDSGFFVSGSSGAIREWRHEGGFCPSPTAEVTQTLRWWSPTPTGYLVSGSKPNVGKNDAPLTYFHVEE